MTIAFPGHVNLLKYAFLNSSMFYFAAICLLCKSYTMACPLVGEDNPRALASGLSYIQVNKHGLTILYHLHQCIPYTSRDISC